MTTQGENSGPIFVYALSNILMEAVTINLKPSAIDLIYWVARKDTKIREAVSNLLENPLESMMVVGDGGKVIGVLTTNEAIALKCKRDPDKPRGPKERCKQECEEACRDRGGCGMVIADVWGNCMWECNDKMGTELDQTLEVLF